MTRFEELVVWQRARETCDEVYRVTSTGKLSRDFGLRDQIQRAAVPVMSNIAEGFDRYGRQGFRHFLSVARGSAAELRGQIHLARALDQRDDVDATLLLDHCVALTRMLTSPRRSLG